MKFLNIGLALIFTGNLFASIVPSSHLLDVSKQLKSLEQKYKLKIGVYAYDTNSGKTIAFNATEVFPFQSTFKFIAVSAILAKDSQQPLLKKTVSIEPKKLVAWHPVSGKYIGKNVDLETLAEAAISYSDNVAINSIIQEIGGLNSINQFAHSIGNRSFKLENFEIKLNSNPQIKQDISTPMDMGHSVQKILLGNTLSENNRLKLIHWMKNNTTGYKRIRAGVPIGWTVADKTGSGHYGIANDIGIAWSPVCKPVVLSIFNLSTNPKEKPRDIVVQQITSILFKALSPYDDCFKATTLNG